MAGTGGQPPPAIRVTEGRGERDPAEPRWIAPLPGSDGYWFELVAPARKRAAAAKKLAPLLGQLVAARADTLRVAEDVADRLEEIELLYSIAEVLGRTIGLEEAARVILRHVSEVVGARRSSILVHDAQAELLRPVAGWGIDVAGFHPIRVSDPDSIAARVFRERHMIGFDPEDPAWSTPGQAEGRSYRGSAFLSVPILYPDPNGPPRPVGVINLTDRIGTDAFSTGERRLVGAIASQVAAAIENARLVERDRRQQRIRRELELARDLQLSLLPRPAALGLEENVGARCEPAEGVGGDFYHVLRLPGPRIGVMLGDVSSHGFGAALIMALALSAAGIHAAGGGTPEETLRRLYDSMAPDLARTEMHLSLFYGLVDPAAARLRYANAGHPHAFRLGAQGPPERLRATSPPLGLADRGVVAGAATSWECGSDLLVLSSDGLTEARSASGKAFGEARVLEVVQAHFDAAPAAIVDAVFAAVHAFTPHVTDDRTLLVLRC